MINWTVRPQPGRTRSMATQLNVALALLAVLVFVTVALLLQRALQDELVRARDRDLAGKVEVVRHFLDEVQDDKDLSELRHHLDDVLIGDGQMRIWLVAENGTVLYGGKRAPLLTAERMGRVQVQREDGLQLDGLRLAVAARGVVPASQLIVAIDTHEQEALLQRYRATIAAVCGLGVVLTVLTAAWVGRRSLQPLQRLSREAASLSPTTLSARLSQVETRELQPLVAAFNQALDRVEAAYAQLEGFSADVAHELRTPLATMISATEVALQRRRAAEELRETLELNLEVLREQTVLVNDMLFLAEADRGQLADSLKVTDLRGEAQRVREYFEPLLEDRQQQVLIEGTACAPCSPTLMRRAMVNLVGNAIRYTDPGGAITVALTDADGWVRIAVRNPGAEIPAPSLQRLFERFFRADPARERGSGHHGLGLAIVRAIAVMHDGRTFARSSGGWTEIGLEFPAHLARI